MSEQNPFSNSSEHVANSPGNRPTPSLRGQIQREVKVLRRSVGVFVFVCCCGGGDCKLLVVVISWQLVALSFRLQLYFPMVPINFGIFNILENRNSQRHSACTCCSLNLSFYIIFEAFVSWNPKVFTGPPVRLVLHPGIEPRSDA